MIEGRSSGWLERNCKTLAASQEVVFVKKRKKKARGWKSAANHIFNLISIARGPFLKLSLRGRGLGARMGEGEVHYNNARETQERGSQLWKHEQTLHWRGLDKTFKDQDRKVKKQRVHFFKFCHCK